MSKDSILVIALWLILSTVAIFLWLMTVDSESMIFYTHYSSLMQIITSAGAAFLCYRTMMIFNVNDKARTAWGFLSMGLFFWSAGAILEGVYTLLHQGATAPFPWYANVCFLLLVPFVIMALIAFKKNLNASIPLKGWIATITVFLGALVLGLGINAKGFQEIESINLIITLIYIIFDSVLLAMAVAAASILIGSLLSRPWWFALVGLFIFYLGDMIYTLVRNIDQAGGIILDLTWPVAFGFIAIAATTARAIYTANR